MASCGFYGALARWKSRKRAGRPRIDRELRNLIRRIRHPTAEWLARQITEAFPWASAPAYLVRDNDRAYGPAFRSRVRAMGIRDRPISPRSPWQNPYVERLIGTVRRECLDRVLIFGEAHLRQILSSYAALLQ
jgi:transposase InsO family protein